MTAFRLLAFCFLLFLIIIGSTRLQIGTRMLDGVFAIYSTTGIVHAQQQEQPILSSSKIQEWIDKQSNIKVSFTYLPERPMVGGFTELRFIVDDLKTSTHSKGVFARITITNGQQQQVPLRFYNITAPNGDFFVKYQFTNEGTYQIIVKVNSKYSALTLASFKVVVPFQPFGIVNVNDISPLILPAGLVGIVGAIAILAFMVVIKRKEEGKKR